MFLLEEHGTCAVPRSARQRGRERDFWGEVAAQRKKNLGAIMCLVGFQMSALSIKGNFIRKKKHNQIPYQHLAGRFDEVSFS